MKIFFTTILFFVILQNVFCDTIDYYHVCLDKELIGQYNQHNLNNPPTIEFEKSELVKSKKIYVKYQTDNPCSNCSFFLQVFSIKTNSFFIENKKIGQLKLLEIKISKLLKHSTKYDANKFSVCYYEGNKKNRRLLFFITLK